MEEAAHHAEEAQVRDLLAPLGAIAPAAIDQRRRWRAGRVAAATLGLLAALSGIAVAATQVFGPLHETTLSAGPGPLTCGVVGASAADADASLRARGYDVSWRFETYGTKVEPPNASGVGSVSGGFSATVDSPPPGSIVAQIAPGPGPNEVIAFAQAKDDPNAPQIVQPDCPAKR